jgi:hypothetical protein
MGMGQDRKASSALDIRKALARMLGHLIEPLERVSRRCRSDHALDHVRCRPFPTPNGGCRRPTRPLLPGFMGPTMTSFSRLRMPFAKRASKVTPQADRLIAQVAPALILEKLKRSYITPKPPTTLTIADPFPKGARK